MARGGYLGIGNNEHLFDICLFLLHFTIFQSWLYKVARHRCVSNWLIDSRKLPYQSVLSNQFLMEKSAPIYRRQTDHISADMYLYVCPRGQSEGAQILFMMIVKASRYHLQKQFIMHCIPPSMYLHGCHYPCQRHSRASRYHWQRQFIIWSIHTDDLYMYLLKSSKYSKGKKTSLIEKMQQCQQHLLQDTIDREAIYNAVYWKQQQYWKLPLLHRCTIHLHRT